MIALDSRFHHHHRSERTHALLNMGLTRRPLLWPTATCIHTLRLRPRLGAIIICHHWLHTLFKDLCDSLLLRKQSEYYDTYDLLTHMHFQSVNLLQHPANGAVSRAHQHPDGCKVPEQPQPQTWPTAAQFEYLRWVQQLLEAAQKLHALVVTWKKTQMSSGHGWRGIYWSFGFIIFAFRIFCTLIVNTVSLKSVLYFTSILPWNSFHNWTSASALIVTEFSHS